jgi:hypothetical protein
MEPWNRELPLLLSLARPGICIATSRKACLLKDEEKVEFSKQLIYWKIILERMISSVIISEVNSRMYVVLSEAEICVLYGE